MSGNPQTPTQNIPGMNIPLVNPQTGVPTQAWYRFLVVLWSGLGVPLEFPYSLTPQAGQEAGIVFTDPCTFQANFSGSIAVASVAATLPAVFQIIRVRGGVQSPLGTITFTNTSLAGVFASTGQAQQKLLAGDTLLIVAPGSADPTLSGVFVTFRGSRS